MQQLQLKRVYKYPAYNLMPSPDGKFLAVAGERCIRIFSLPALALEKTIYVRDPSSMAYLEDGSLLILNTTGGMFHWRDNTLHPLGHWPDRLWRERPIFRCGPDSVVLGYDEGVCRYCLSTGQFTPIYTCPDKFLYFAGVADGLLHFLIHDREKNWDFPSYVVMDPQGTIHSCSVVDHKINCLVTSRPGIIDGGYLAMTSFRKHPILGGSVLYLISPDGHTTEIDLPKHFRCTPCISVVGSSRYLAVPNDFHHDLTILDRKDVSTRFYISTEELHHTSKFTQLSDCLFLSDTEFLVGTWTRLFQYEITEQLM